MNEHVCSKCGHVSWSRADLEYHVAKLHSSAMPHYRCEWCSARFADYMELQVHRIQQHNERAPRPGSEEPSQAEIDAAIASIHTALPKEES